MPISCLPKTKSGQVLLTVAITALIYFCLLVIGICAFVGSLTTFLDSMATESAIASSPDVLPKIKSGMTIFMVALHLGVLPLGFGIYFLLRGNVTPSAATKPQGERLD